MNRGSIWLRQQLRRNDRMGIERIKDTVNKKKPGGQVARKKLGYFYNVVKCTVTYKSFSFKVLYGVDYGTRRGDYNLAPYVHYCLDHPLPTSGQF
jgi:hypothetical protein